MNSFLIAALTSLAVIDAGEADVFFVCGNVGSEKHKGNYTAAGYQDGIHKYTNANKMSIYRHNGFWYIGDVSVWPPTTHYRCVSDCPKDEDLPTVDLTFETNLKKGRDPPPTLHRSLEPCQ